MKLGAVQNRLNSKLWGPTCVILPEFPAWTQRYGTALLQCYCCYSLVTTLLLPCCFARACCLPLLGASLASRHLLLLLYAWLLLSQSCLLLYQMNRNWKPLFEILEIGYSSLTNRMIQFYPDQRQSAPPPSFHEVPLLRPSDV
jgi:hypothetical protein